MRPGYNLPPLMFTADEIEAIAVGLSLLGRTGMQGWRFQRVVSSGRSPTFSRTVPRTLLMLSLCWFRIGTLFLRPERTITLYARPSVTKKSCNFAIECRARTTERTICPIGLIYFVDNVLLAAWCELRANFRHFRADRIGAGCALTGDFFKRQGRRLRTDWRLQYELLSPSLERK